MTTNSAKIFFTPAGPALDLRCHDGAMERGVTRQPAELDAAQFRPVQVTSYRQLLELVAAAGVTFAEEDAANEAARRAADTLKREQEAVAAKDREKRNQALVAQREAEAAAWKRQMGIKS